MQTASEQQQPHLPNRFQILSLDGGGIKGIFSVAVLAAIEEDLNINVVDHFDLIAGTSTGGIIAIGLGLGLRPREILEFYVREGPAIFGGWSFLKQYRHLVKRKYSANALEAALKRTFKEKRFGDSKQRLVIPSYNIGEDDVYLFRTPHEERLRRDYKVPAWQVAKATSAAPSFFPCTKDVGGMRLIDGGVWANNPTLVAIVEAHGPLKVPLADIHVLSIGTSDPIVQRPKELDEGGVLAWAGAAVDIIMRGQSVGVNNQAKFLLGEDRVVRLDPRVPNDEYSLDGIHKATELVAKAFHHSRAFIPTFQSCFAGHKAPAFVPLYH